MLHRPPTSPLFPYTTLFRSGAGLLVQPRVLECDCQMWRQLLQIGEMFLGEGARLVDRKSTRLNSSHLVISYAVFCLKKKNNNIPLVLINRIDTTCQNI